LEFGHFESIRYENDQAEGPATIIAEVIAINANSFGPIPLPRPDGKGMEAEE
jgi:hypothetical protein